MSRAAATQVPTRAAGRVPVVTQRPTDAVAVLLGLLLTGAAPVTGQELPFDLPVEIPWVTGYDPAVPTPEAVIGHRVGTRHTRPDQLVDYVRAVAAVSDRVVVGEHGRTHQGRPLVHAIVTAEGNHERLELLRLRNLRLSDEPGAVTDAELAGWPTVVYLGYSVHGNEASGSEAALLLLYHLAAGHGSGVADVLQNTIIVLDPSLNPDGRARFVEWVNGNRGAVATGDPQGREQSAPWPGGRTNHYLFDLNRDWLPAAHPESRGRLELFHAWRPQLHTDVHEMGGAATYFFQPGEPSRDNPNTPASTTELTGAVAEYHARALDGIGALYYTREQFDDFYYGKGSTYPDVNGAIGILFEQASSRGLLAETPFGELSYAYTVRNQLLTSLSSLRAAVELRERLLRHQRDFYAGAPAFARAAGVSAYIWSHHPDRTRAQEFAGLLQRHRIRVHELGRPVQADGRRFEPGQAFIVPVDQPQARLVQGMMERRTEFRDSLFYDVSAWTLPLAYGLEHAELRGGVTSLLGPLLGPVTPDGGGVMGGPASYAYVMDWDRYHAPRALYRLLDAGVRPLLVTTPFQGRVDDRTALFAPGSIIIPVTGRDGRATPAAEDLHRLVDRLAREDHVVFRSLATGLSADGPDLGTPTARVLSTPRTALLTGAGTSSYEVGAAWHLLDARIGMPVTLLDVDRVAGGDLSRYDVILMAGYRGGLGEAGEARLRDWVRGGGTLVATGASTAWAARTGWTGVSARPAPELDLTGVAYGDLARRTGAHAMGGAIFQAELDRTHPLAFGLPARMAVFRDHGTFLAPVDRPGAVVARYSDAPLLSGYISPRNLEALAGSPAVVASREGRGRVIVLADDPAFRAFWKGTERLLVNALFFGRTF
jgi:hypothetical protein